MQNKTTTIQFTIKNKKEKVKCMNDTSDILTNTIKLWLTKYLQIGIFKQEKRNGRENDNL